MKKRLLSLLMLFAVSANAQKDPSTMQVIQAPDSTGFGTPDGKSVNKQIGTAGGTIGVAIAVAFSPTR